MHRVMIVPVCLGGLLLPPGKPAVQAHGRAVLAFVVWAAVVRRRPARRKHAIISRAVGMASEVERTRAGLVVRTGDPGAPVGVGMDGERRAGHVEAGPIRALFCQKVSGVELQTARHQISGGLGQAFAQHLHVGHHIRTLSVAQNLPKRQYVILGKPQSFDLREFLGLGVARHNFAQVVQRRVQVMHARALPRVGLKSTHLGALDARRCHLSFLWAALLGFVSAVLIPALLLLLGFIILIIIAGHLRLCSAAALLRLVQLVLSEGASVVAVLGLAVLAVIVVHPVRCEPLDVRQHLTEQTAQHCGGQPVEKHNSTAV